MANSDLFHDLGQYLKQNHKSPEDYIIDKFADHDIIFIGEVHRVKHDVKLICDILPLLHEHGINVLATEFACQSEQADIDNLISSDKYDEKAARHILFSKFVGWGYQEYADIFKSAWLLNRNIRDNSRRFKILGISDSPDWSFVKTPEDRVNRDVLAKVFDGQGEKLWVECLIKEVVEKGEKALVYSGLHHAFTQYRQPIVENGKLLGYNDDRCGNYIYDKIGKRATTICLHQPWYAADNREIPLVKPVNGVIDMVMESVKLKSPRIGFDITGTPFADLTSDDSIYKLGNDDFRLGSFCDGYIYQKPLSLYESVTAIPDFINENNIEKAREQCPAPNLKSASIDEFNRAIADDLNNIKYFRDLP